MKHEQRIEAIRLRVEERLSIEQIRRVVKCAKGSISLWLREYPLTQEELRVRSAANGARTAAKAPYRIKPRGIQSKFHAVTTGQSLSIDRKCKIAEAAVLFRLALHGFIIFKPYFDGAKEDLLVYKEAGKIIKVQVRWARSEPIGLPIVSLRCSDGRGKNRRYSESDFDVVVGYDLYTDTAYVFTHDDVRDVKNFVTVRPEVAEAWSKLDSL